MLATARTVLPAALATLLLLDALPAQGSMIVVPPGREVKETKLLTPGVTDEWKFDATAGAMLWCKVDSNDFDPVLDLADSDGKVLCSVNGDGTHRELWRQLPAKGPMRLLVHGFNGGGGGHYSFWLQRFDTEALAAESEASHTFGKEQWWHYRVALHAGDVLVPTAGGDGRVTAVFDLDRNGVPELHGGFRALHDGEHIVRIEGPEQRIGRLVTALARQRPMPPGGVVEATMPSYGYDLWYLRLQAGKSYVLDLKMPAAQFTIDQYERERGDGPAFARLEAFDKAGRRVSWLLAHRDCEAALLLRNTGGASGPYRVDFATAAAELGIDRPVTGRIELGTADLWCMPAASGQLLRLSLAADDFDATLQLFDPNGNRIAMVDDCSPLDRNAEHTFLVTQPGCYRVLAHCVAAAGRGAYTLRADAIAVPELRGSEPLPLHLQGGGTARVHAQLQAGQEAWLSVRSREFDAALTLFDPDGVGIGTFEGGGAGGDVLQAFVPGKSGSYTLQVFGRSGAGAGVVQVMRL
ncbi:MAG TPA: hypothetical protein VK348_08705 [Planctomycetota bacterium]|nr:hypothetical protein [Planctomycetota bacterium]